MRDLGCVSLVVAEMAARPPGRVLGALRDVLARELAASDVELLVADYGMTVLRPVRPVRPADRVDAGLPIDRTVAGRAFTGKRLTTGTVEADGVLVHVPVTVRGSCRGVLRMRLPTAPDEALRGELVRMGAAVGYGLAVIARDTDLLEQAARCERLTLAAEMQWQLLPGRHLAGAELTVAGQLEPAYEVRGDAFDWACASDHVVLAACDGMGEGAAAAMLSHLAVSALRNARRAGLDLTAQASLADQAIWAHHRGRLYVETVLLRLDLSGGRAEAIDAGSAVLLRDRDSEVSRVELERQLPLGMFEGSQYRPQELDLRPGDRLLVASDGVHAAQPGEAGSFGERHLPRLVEAVRGRPPEHAVRWIVRELLDHHGGAPLADDAVVLCLDWRGPVA